MKLYCVIDDVKYEIVEGATFSEEYNETLDSGTIMLDQIPRIEGLEPFDDVYIYDVETNGEKFYKHMLVDTFSEEMNNVRFKLYKYKVHLFSETKKLEKVILPNISITQPVDKDRRRSVWEYLNVYLDLYSPKLKVKTDNSSWKYERKYIFSNFHDLPEEYEEIAYLESTGTQWIRTNIQIREGDQLIIEFKDFDSVGYVCGQNDQTTTGNPYFQIRCPNNPDWRRNLFDISYHKTGNMYDFVFNKITNTYNGYIGLFCTTDDGNPLGSTEGTVGSGKIYYLKYYHNKLLTSYLIPCKRKSDGVLGFYDLEGNHTFYTNMGSGTFNYEAKRKPKHFNYNSVYEVFSNVDAPEMSLTNPTLRDVISQLMLTKDCIPVVHDDVIDYIDVSLRNGIFEFNPDYVSYIHSGMNSEEYSTEARREYSGALSQENTCKMIEYLGFRDSNTSLLKLSDIVLETRYPIYKINKMYMCYYKRAQIVENNVSKYVRFMCKQDITPLVVQNTTRQALSLDPGKFRDLLNQGSNMEDSIAKVSIDELASFKVCTVGYNIGSNRIVGWGESFSYFIDDLYWYKQTYTVLENIIEYVDRKTPFGYKKAGVVVKPHSVDYDNKVYIFDVDNDGLASIDSGGLYDNVSNRQKAVFFQVEYDAMYGGALVHSKDFKDQDDLMTADNCSSSLTVLEVDGLFEKEKMNRLGNRQYNIQARYTGPNAYEIMNNPEDDPDIPGCNHILGSVLENENEALYANVDDIIIYHKEYQIYENMILANYAGTYDYVLKNYFTSVYAKLRTYNLATYGESVVRAENYKEYVILSEDKATYENNTLLYDNLSKYISCFNITFQDERTYNDIKNNQINFGYIQTNFFGEQDDINKSIAFCDINTFCSGYSFCINLKMYDNVSQGVYIKETQKEYVVDEGTAIGSVQEWAISVDDVTDPFQERMAFGFGHLYQSNDDIPNNKSVFIPEYSFDPENVNNNSIQSSAVKTIYENKLLWFPTFYTNNYLRSNVSFKISIGEQTNGLIIYKDNKEIIDYTFQFEPITNSKNIFFSSYFTKLNDMNGIYSKNDITYSKTADYGPYSNSNLDCQIRWSLSNWRDVDNKPRSSLMFYLRLPKVLTAQYSPFIIQQPNDITKSPPIPVSGEDSIDWQGYYQTDNLSYEIFWPHSIIIEMDANSNPVVSVKFNVAMRDAEIYVRKNEFDALVPYFRWEGSPSSTQRTARLSYDSEDDNYYYYAYSPASLASFIYNDYVPDGQEYRYDRPLDLNALGEETASLDLDFLTQRFNATKNLFAIVSSKKINKDIFYDTYLSGYVPFLTEIEKETEYDFEDDGIIKGANYIDSIDEDGFIFNVTFTVPGHPNIHGGGEVPFTRISVSRSAVYYEHTYEGMEYRIPAARIEADRRVYWYENGYNKVVFSGGSDLNNDMFKSWFTLANGINVTNYSGVNIKGLPNDMIIVNTDDSSCQLSPYYYISFDKLFSFVPVTINTAISSGRYILYDRITFPENISSFNITFKCLVNNEYITFNTISFTNTEMYFGSTKVYDSETGWESISYSFIYFDSDINPVVSFKHWLEQNTDDYDLANIPTIRVGNINLQNYVGVKQDFDAIRSIQFWYLDNNGEGAGRLQFVFGVNVEPGQYEKEIYVSVATKRSPYIYSDDHKHIIGSVKQMTPTNYEQNNVMVPYQDVAPTIAIKDDTLTISTTSSVSESYDVYVDNVLAQNITTTTFDLSSLNLNEGTYAIKVKAKTSIGLSDSDFSNVVSFTV